MKHLLILTIVFLLVCGKVKGEKVLWQLGTADYSAAEFALGPDGYKQFLECDFGYEDRYFVIGKSDIRTDFAYIMPGPIDTWGGTWGTAGWRTHEANILFALTKLPVTGKWKLIVDLVDSHPYGSVVKLTVNERQRKFNIRGGSDKSAAGNMTGAKKQRLEMDLFSTDFTLGGNRVSVSILEGSWIIFDEIRLISPDGAMLKPIGDVFIRTVEAAAYELNEKGECVQPLLIDMEHISGTPYMEVKLDGTTIFQTQLDTARYLFEAPMPAVSSIQTSRYAIYINGKIEQEGNVTRSSHPLYTLADYVDTRMGTAHSRWMIAPGPWMPFSMIKLSPDNQNSGWQAGYQPTFESIGTFSHIHEWTMAGLGTLPVVGTPKNTVGDERNTLSGYRSQIDKASEEAPIGKYKVYLSDYDIWAELSATTRCSFQRYSYGKEAEEGGVLIELHVRAEYDYQLSDIQVTRVSSQRIEGKCHQLSPGVWSKDADQDYILHFVMEFDQPFVRVDSLNNHLFNVVFDTSCQKTVQVRTGISLVSIANASENLQEEITKPFDWNFEAVVTNQLKVWNSYFDRLKISTNDALEKKRFYTNMYRALCSRNIWSDVNGQWIAPDETVQTMVKKGQVALGCDAFWNTFWNLNQFWNLVTPEWSSQWVGSQLAMYDACGWLAKGPAGMEYIPVMVAEHEIPLMVSAYQMGIRDFDAEHAYQAMRKMQTTPAQHVAGGFAGNRDLEVYMKYKYVPFDKGRFSNTLEYAYDDWTLGQMAKALGKNADYNYFNERGSWWRNVIDSVSGYAVLKDSTGTLTSSFDPYRSGKNVEYVEGNAWQLTYFVPQDVPALADVIGRKRFTDRLEWGFAASEPWRYNAPNDQYWDYPVVQGNQQSMHFAFLFNWAGKPWLTQKWSRSVVNRYYGSGVANAYLGDEDQGQMSAWFVMVAIGLFQTDGGCSVNPIYEIGSPLFERIEIDLGKRYGRGNSFTIEARNASRRNIYVQSAMLNNSPLRSFHFPASELLKGGTLILEMGDTPNEQWGVQSSGH